MTLLNLTQAAADWIRKTPGLAGDLHAMTVDLALFGRTSMHGTLDKADLQGFDPHTQSLLVKSGHKAAWRYDVTRPAADMLRLVASACRVQQPELAQVMAVETVCSSRASRS